MPDAVPSVSRYRRSLSRGNNNSAVLAIVSILSTLQQWFPCGPLLARHLTRLHPSLFLPRSRRWLLPEAAEGSLEPAPASRFRGAYPHQSNSCAPPQPFGRLLFSWHTVVGISEKCPVDLRMLKSDSNVRRLLPAGCRARPVRNSPPSRAADR